MLRGLGLHTFNSQGHYGGDEINDGDDDGDDDDDDDDNMPISFVKETGIPRGNHCPIRQVGLLLTKL